MIRSPIGLRLSVNEDVKANLREAARLGAKGVIFDAAGELGPDRLSESGRRDLRHTLRSVELSLIALHLPTRRAFDSEDQLEHRLSRADGAFALAYELGARMVLTRVGSVPPDDEPKRLDTFKLALSELARRAGHRGIRFAIETGPDSGETLRTFLDALGKPDLAASIDPGSLIAAGQDPVAATRALGPWVAHAYATDATGQGRATGIIQQRRSGFPAGALDWEEYLGSLEEIDYRGYLTVWPDPTGDVPEQARTIIDRLKRF
jgi:sugar phosphate isomerase/epimerase